MCVWPSQYVCSYFLLNATYMWFSFLNNFSKMPSIRNWSTLVYDLAMISNMCVLANHWHWECNDRWQTTEVTHIASMMKLDTSHSYMSASLLHVDVGKRMLLLRPNFHPGAMKVVKKTGALLFCLPLLLRRFLISMSYTTSANANGGNEHLPARESDHCLRKNHVSW